MTDRAALLHYWRVVMAQQDAFWRRDNKTRNYAFSLLEYAGNARREMMTCGHGIAVVQRPSKPRTWVRLPVSAPIQPDLFAADCAATDAR